MRLALSAILTVCLPGIACCQTTQRPDDPAIPSPSPLPVKTVTLFTSGVAYTERGGEVDGDAKIPLIFRTGQVNDILKSMVLLDSGGRVQPATYAARDPIGRTLQAFAVDVTQNQSLMQILTQLRGATVTVDSSGKGPITGRIIGVESRQITEDNGKPVNAQFLNLLSENGLNSIRLDSVQNIRLQDPRLDKEFREALALLATGSDDQRRQVTLHFAGDGRRQVRVGYVTEAPLWKMSYRLVLGKGDKPYLQGWALVENTSDDDWNSVRLSLVSGRPVSFIQDLYQPLYLPRPVVAPDVVASPYPQTHAGSLEGGEKAAQLAAKAPLLADLPLLGSLSRKAGAAPGERGESGGSRRILDKDGNVVGFDLDNSIIINSSDALRLSVKAQASGQSAGELFKYEIATPVSLPRQQAAMIPVVAQDIDGEKLLLFNPDSGKFPLNAFRVRNNTKLHLKGGPITLFDDGTYAGDAKMEDIPPGDNRLVTYAVDLTVEGERQEPKANLLDVSYAMKRGVLFITRREKTETTYTLKSKADRPRAVLIEHPFNSDFKLLQPAKAAERTAGLYQFEVTVQPAKSEKLLVVTERPISQTVAVLDTDLTAIGFYANKKEVPQKVRETLQEVVQRRRKVAELEAQVKAQEAEIGAIMQDQERIRKNMGALDKLSALYKRYVTELDSQETRIQYLRKEAARLRAEAAAADKDLRAYLDGITIGNPPAEAEPGQSGRATP